MRIVPLLCLLPLPALAQVTTDTSALDALKPAAPSAAPSAPAAGPPTPPHHAAPRHATVHKSPPHVATAAVQPSVPAAPPPNPVIVPPPPVLPQHPREVPPPPEVDPNAAGTATKIPNGARITFAPGSAALNVQTNFVLLLIANQARHDNLLQVTLTAWAPGTDADPSTPRRLALDRVLAARAVLIRAGIESERIHAIAKGYLDIGSGPPDRLDIVAAHPAPPPPGTPVAAPPPKPAVAAAGANAATAGGSTK